MDMVTTSTALSRDDVFVDLVCFKWLMADLGCWVDLPRMRHDPVYAGECASRGVLAQCSVLRQRSWQLLALLKEPAMAEQDMS